MDLQTKSWQESGRAQAHDQSDSTRSFKSWKEWIAGCVETKLCISTTWIFTPLYWAYEQVNKKQTAKSVMAARAWKAQEIRKPGPG